MLSIGIIGYGFSAQTFHVPLIEAAEGCTLSAVASSRPELVKTNHPGMQVFHTPEEMLDHSDVDLVVITTPNVLHYPQALLCLQHGRHVVLEKPMTCAFAQAQELCGLASRMGLTLSVFHNRRWDGDFLTLTKLLREKSVGEVTFFESHFDRFRPSVRNRWRENPGLGSGFWYDLGSHLLDQVLFLFGEPLALTARCKHQRPKSGAIDYFHVMLHYPVTEVILHGSCFSAGPNRRYHLEGSDGSYIKYGLDPQEQHLKHGVSPNHPSFGREKSIHYGTLYKEDHHIQIPTLPGCYLDYYTKLISSIVQTGKPPVTAEEGARVIRLIELAEKSSLEGRTIIL